MSSCGKKALHLLYCTCCRATIAPLLVTPEAGAGEYQAPTTSTREESSLGHVSPSIHP